MDLTRAEQDRGTGMVSVTLLSHPGVVRTTNEDAAVVGCLQLTESVCTHSFQVRTDLRETLVIAIADGLGGHAGGEVAAAMAVRSLASRGTELTTDAAVGPVLTRISQEITERARTDRTLTDMATTVVGLALTSEHTLCFNVGDSLAYYIEGGYLSLISTPDSLGRITDDGSPQATGAFVTQVLGPPSRELDPHVRVYPAHPLERYLLCSDGLSDIVGTAEIESLLHDHASDDDLAVRTMWAEAMNRGAPDNITIALVRRG